MDASGTSPEGPESTADLLALARGGSASAVERLCGRYLPRLTIWARGRLPARARDLLDTEDIVQEVLIRTVQVVHGFEPAHEGSFHGYLRRALQNRLTDEYRKARRVPPVEEIGADHESGEASPLEQAIGRENLALYEKALSELREEEREAVIARIEMQCSYEEIADALGKTSRNAARMTVVRAIQKLLEKMEDEERT